MKENQREELLKHLAASLQDAKKEGGAILLVGAGISVSAGIPPAQKLMQIAIENFPNYFTEEEQRLAQEDLSQLQYNSIMTKLSNVKRKELFKWFIEGNKDKGIQKAKLNFAHIAIAELLKQGYFSRILTVNFDPLLINACYMVGMYPLPAIYDIGSVDRINPELFNDPCIIYLNGQHVGQVQRNTTNQLTQHDPILQKVVHSTGCTKTWIVAGYSGENDPLMTALKELRPYSNWLYWLEYNDQILQNESHQFLETDEECKVIYACDADETFMEITENLKCSLDFIEKPYKELEMYLKEINFNSATYSKGRIYKILIGKYIDILSNDENIKKLQDIKKTEIILNNTMGFMAQFVLDDDLTIEALDEGIAFLKTQYSENQIIDILEAFCMGLCKKFEILKDTNTLKEEIAFALSEAQLHKTKSATLHAQIIRLHSIVGEFDSAITELTLFPVSEALERKPFFLNNNEMRQLSVFSQFKSWYSSTFNEIYPH
ncbi:hypothetical protein [Acinetobacter sp. ANC 4178]|uniref:hypothetical protein n=1 Tax=Acinetobacter sp. ANC 4178 TaxID=2529839 RepID=UPI001D0D8D9D|nr:hypothetical protein [Acinetobacter sp. ANC 4178]